MALELEAMLAESLRDLLEGGWAKYLELENGQVRTSWHQEGELRWLEVWDHSGTELVGRFMVTVGVYPFELPSIGPEDDGALRAELAGQAREPEPVERFWAEVCRDDMAQGGDGKFYRVTRAAAGTGANAGFTVVTLDLNNGDAPRTYTMRPDGAVQVIRGEEGQAADTLAGAGLGPEVIRS